jgi:integrase
MPWLYKQRGSEYWWVGYRVNGRQMLRTTKKKSRADAEKVLAQMTAMVEAQRARSLTEEFYRALTGTELPKVSLKSALAEWLAECRSTTARKTLDKYSAVAGQFETFLKADDATPLLRDITVDEIRSFLLDCHKRQAASSVNVARKVLSVFFNRAIGKRQIAVNPVRGTKRIKDPKSKRVERRPFSTEELQSILAKAPNPFWRYMILGGLYTGLRLGDLICLRAREVDLTQNVLRLTITSPSSRYCPITVTLAALGSSSVQV